MSIYYVIPDRLLRDLVCKFVKRFRANPSCAVNIQALHEEEASIRMRATHQELALVRVAHIFRKHSSS